MHINSEKILSCLLNLGSLLSRAPSSLAPTAGGLKPLMTMAVSSGCMLSVSQIGLLGRKCQSQTPGFLLFTLGGSSYKHHPADFHKFSGSTVFEDALEQYFSNLNGHTNPLEILWNANSGSSFPTTKSGWRGCTLTLGEMLTPLICRPFQHCKAWPKVIKLWTPEQQH